MKNNSKIKEVNVYKNFPNKVIINVKENKTIAYLIKDNNYYPILETGTILDKVTENQSKNSVPLIKQFKSNDESLLKNLIVELKKLPIGIQNTISEIQFSQAQNEKSQIILYTKDGFTVSSSITNFSKKMALYPSIIQNLDPKKYPVIHLEDAIYANENL
ncbi:cell division protein FtsQ/DivIB [Bacillus cereus]|uniref:cell division protein FtsQ/DivIB n=1 Tax=Bacillus cereus TaxID=1396 RepID=UPI0031F5B02A